MRIAGIYAVVGIGWLSLSGRIAGWLTSDLELAARSQQWQQLVFVLAGAALIFGLVNRRRESVDPHDEEFKTQERYFRDLFEKAPAAYQSLDARGRLIAVNTAWLDLLGYASRDDVLGHPLAEFLEASQLVLMQERFPRFKTSGRLDDAEFVLKRRDGELVTVTVDGRIQYDEDGNFRQTHCVLHDITERKAAERALRDSERRLSLALDGARLGTFEWDLRDDTVFWDSRQAELYGIEQADFTGTTDDVLGRIYADDLDRVQTALIQAQSSGELLVVEYRAVHPDGSVRWLSAAGRCRFGADGEPIGLLGVTKDIDSRKRAEIERDRLFEHSVDLLCVTDLRGTFLQVNPAWARVLGWSRDELVDRNWFDYQHPGEREANLSAAARLEAGQPLENHVNRFRCRDGSYRWLSWNTFPFLEENVMLATARDVTDRHRLEEQLRQAQKMEAVGQLAGGVAHDFNNLLQVINGYSAMALDELAEDHHVRRFVVEVAAAGGRAAGLVGQLLAFSRRQVLEPEILDLNQVVDGLLKMAHRTLGEHLTIDWLPAPELGTTRADRGQVEQILMNLWINARDAMPDGGVLTITTKNVDFTAEFCRSQAWARPGRYVMLAVTDSGVGMDAGTMERIWEPFFTTKAPGQGTGLGLSTVYGIVRQHEGLVHLDTAPGRGTTFEIYLPLAARPVVAEGEPATPQAVGGHERILVAEDDTEVRELMRTVLERAGYDVVTAADGSTALAYLEEHGDAVDLALLDVVMPGLSGHEVRDRVRARLPRLRFLFASGYNLDGARADLDRDDGFELVQKPFEAAVLLSRVRLVLD